VNSLKILKISIQEACQVSKLLILFNDSQALMVSKWHYSRVYMVAFWH